MATAAMTSRRMSADLTIDMPKDESDVDVGR